jgi:hypothetical protein
MASAVTRQSLVSRSTTAGGSAPSSMVAGPGSTPRARVANATPSSASTHRTTAATVATSNGVSNCGKVSAPSSAASSQERSRAWSTRSVTTCSSGTGLAGSPRPGA